MSNRPILAAVLVLIIVACVGFMVFKGCGNKPAGAGGASMVMDRDMICLSCNKTFKVKMSEQEWMPMQMQGRDLPKKLKCPGCGKEDGIPAVKCPHCGELVPSPGMRMAAGPGMGGSACPKCKKPLPIPGMPGMRGPGSPPPPR